METSIPARAGGDVRRLIGLLVLALTLATVSLWPPASPASSDPRTQAERLCSRMGVFEDKQVPPSWVCVRGMPDFTDRDKAQAERLCVRQGGSFASGFDSQLNFLACDL